MTRDQIIDQFRSNYSERDILNMLIDRMTYKELETELAQFELISNDPDNSEYSKQ